jgi:hypothetical protein
LFCKNYLQYIICRKLSGENEMAQGKNGAKPRGRPALPPDKGKRHALGIRTTKELKDLLQGEAVSSGRSLAQEIEFRLDQSFAEDRGLGGLRTAAIFRKLAATAEFVAGRDEKWLDDYEAFNTVVDFWWRDLMAMRPSEPEEVTRQIADFKARVEGMPRAEALFALRLRMLDKGLPHEVRQEFEARIADLQGGAER